MLFQILLAVFPGHLLELGNGRGVAGGGFLNEYAVGKNGDIFPEGTGRLVKAGAKVRFNMHYHSNGEAKVDQSEIALVFYPKGYVPKYYIQSAHTGDTEDLDIPAGMDNVRSDGYTRLTKIGFRRGDGAWAPSA